MMLYFRSMTIVDNMKITEDICKYTCDLHTIQELINSNELTSKEKEKYNKYKETLENIIEYLKTCDSLLVLDQIPPDFDNDKIKDIKVFNIDIVNILQVQKNKNGSLKTYMLPVSKERDKGLMMLLRMRI